MTQATLLFHTLKEAVGKGQAGLGSHVERQVSSLRMRQRRGSQPREGIAGQPAESLPACVHGKDGISSSPASSSSVTHNASPSPPVDLTVMEPSAVRSHAGTPSHVQPSPVSPFMNSAHTLCPPPSRPGCILAYLSFR